MDKHNLDTRVFKITEDMTFFKVAGKLKEDSSGKRVSMLDQSGNSLEGFDLADFSTAIGKNGTVVVGLHHIHSFFTQIVQVDPEITVLSNVPEDEVSSGLLIDIDNLLIVGPPGKSITLRTDDVMAFDFTLTLSTSIDNHEVQAFIPEDLIAKVDHIFSFSVNGGEVKENAESLQIVDVWDQTLFLCKDRNREGAQRYYNCPVSSSDLSTKGYCAIRMQHLNGDFCDEVVIRGSAHILSHGNDVLNEYLLILVNEDDTIIRLEGETHWASVHCQRLESGWKVDVTLKPCKD